MSRPISLKRLLGSVILGLGLFIFSLELSREDGLNILFSYYWLVLMIVPGLLFGLSISVGIRLSALRSFILVAISTAIYYASIGFASQFHRSNQVFQSSIIALGSGLELLAIAIMSGLVRKVKWWFYLVALGIGCLSFIFLNYPILGLGSGVYPSIVFWQITMAWLIYFMMSKPNSEVTLSAV